MTVDHLSPVPTTSLIVLLYILSGGVVSMTGVYSYDGFNSSGHDVVTDGSD